MEQLPLNFLSRMKEMLGEEYQDFLDSYDSPRQFGLRVNTLKTSVEDFLETAPFHLTPIPWIPNGFFYGEEERPSRHAFYTAGLYYLQEPSAMTPASRLDITPGDYVLDLCAAPGGKATELGARLQGKGLLVANDISNSRAKALLRNLELFGIPNSLVTNEVPKHLAGYFPEFFDKILVDAPCSGEGMFRKDPDVAKTWDESRPGYFSKLQKDIIEQAISMLKPGGKLMYSTCTFSPEENEGLISYVLEHFPEMELLEMEDYEGFSKGTPKWGNTDARLTRTRRIFPHHMEGEGHFLALLQKKGTLVPSSSSPVSCRLKKEDQKLLEEFFSSLSLPFHPQGIEVRNGFVYRLPDADTGSLKGIKFLRHGLFLGELKKNRFEPSQPFAMALRNVPADAKICLDPLDPRISTYLRGESFCLEEGETPCTKGWKLICAGQYPLGWGKTVGNTLKNKYPSGWRQSY